MNAQLMSQSPLLALPLFALFVFGLVFLSVAIRAFMTSDATIRVVSDLPLEDEGSHEA